MVICTCNHCVLSPADELCVPEVSTNISPVMRFWIFLVANFFFGKRGKFYGGEMFNLVSSRKGVKPTRFFYINQHNVFFRLSLSTIVKNTCFQHLLYIFLRRRL